MTTEKKNATSNDNNEKVVEKYLKEIDDDEDSGMCQKESVFSNEKNLLSCLRYFHDVDLFAFHLKRISSGIELSRRFPSVFSEP